MSGIAVPQLCDHVAACIEAGHTSDAMITNVRYIKVSYQALDAENAILRTEKHADAEAIGSLRAEIARLSEAITQAHDCMEDGCDSDAWAVLRDARAALNTEAKQ
jgi:hypothetical protein